MSLVSIARRPSHLLTSPVQSAAESDANHEEKLEQRRYSASLSEVAVVRSNNNNHGVSSAYNSPTLVAAPVPKAKSDDTSLDDSVFTFNANEKHTPDIGDNNGGFQKAQTDVTNVTEPECNEHHVANETPPVPSSNYYTIKGAAVFLNSQLFDRAAVRPRTPVVKHDDSCFLASPSPPRTPLPLPYSPLLSCNLSPPVSPTPCSRLSPTPPPIRQAAEISRHLGLMLDRLRDEDQIMMAAKLETSCASRARYLTLIYNSHLTNLDHNEYSEDTSFSALLGFDVTTIDAAEETEEKVSLGLAIPVQADMKIRLTGDGGFTTSLNERSYSFKPVAVQVMWACLHSITEAIMRANRNFRNSSVSSSLSSAWLTFYNQKIDSDPIAIADWQLMDDVISRLPPADSESAIELEIRDQLRTLMSSIDLEEASSRTIRTSLEAAVGRDLSAYRQFIDEEMLVLLGQLDLPSEIFDYLYLGSEWNASDIQVLMRLGITHVVNVSREIDNFFPSHFRYYNVRVYDDESTELLRYWNSVYKFIENARLTNGRTLVHCKMGVSRSAACVIAYCMKAVGQSRDEAINFVRNKRACVQPNKGFMDQLHVYEGILKASRVRHSDLFKHVDAIVNEASTLSPTKTTTSQQIRPASFHESTEDTFCLNFPGTTTLESRIAAFETVLGSAQQQQNHGRHYRNQEERRLRNRTSPAVPTASTLEFLNGSHFRRQKPLIVNEVTGSKEDLCSEDYYPESGHVRRVTAQLMTPVSPHPPSLSTRSSLAAAKRASTAAKFLPNEARRSSTGLAIDDAPRNSWPLCQHEPAEIMCEK